MTRKRDKFIRRFSKVWDFSLPMLVSGGILATLLVSCDARSEEASGPEVPTKQCEFVTQLSPYQQSIAHMSYRAGEPYDLGLTAVAIGWHESKLGIYKVRFNTGDIKDISVGVMHTVAYWKTKNMDSFEAGRWVQDMIDIDQKSIDTGVQDILYWQSHSGGSWKKGVGMYNGGWKGNSQYANEISKLVSELKNCKF